jgi:sulfopyruvate decarboxylase subunit alpha
MVKPYFLHDTSRHARLERGHLIGSETMSAIAERTWQAALADALAAEAIESAVWVPDKRLSPIATALGEHGLAPRALTREEECVGYACGHRAAGGRPLVLFQCSGLGNALNAIGSLAVPYGLGFVLVLSMRGTLGESNPSQVPLGRATVPMLELLGIQALSLREPAAAAVVAAGAARLAHDARQVVAIILEPELEQR